MILALLVFLTLILVWRFWVRPILRLTPSFKELFDREDSFWAAVRLKLAGIKQKLVTVATFIATVAVSAHDFLVPLAQQAGLNVQAVLPMIPTWAWPLITMALIAAVQGLRNLADRREE